MYTKTAYGRNGCGSFFMIIILIKIIVTTRYDISILSTLKRSNDTKPLLLPLSPILFSIQSINALVVPQFADQSCEINRGYRARLDTILQAI